MYIWFWFSVVVTVLIASGLVWLFLFPNSHSMDSSDGFEGLLVVVVLFGLLFLSGMSTAISGSLLFLLK